MALAILDIDGTLVDTNYQHALAWYRAFRRHGIVLPVWRIHRHIGMGGDQVVAALTDERTENELGDKIRAAEKELYFELIEEVEPMEGSRELIEQLRRRDHTVVLASSAKEEEVEHYLELLDARELANAWTTSFPGVSGCTAANAPNPAPVITPAASLISERLAPRRSSASRTSRSWTSVSVRCSENTLARADSPAIFGAIFIWTSACCSMEWASVRYLTSCASSVSGVMQWRSPLRGRVNADGQ